MCIRDSLKTTKDILGFAIKILALTRVELFIAVLPSISITEFDTSSSLEKIPVNIQKIRTERVISDVFTVLLMIIAL